MQNLIVMSACQNCINYSNYFNVVVLFTPTIHVFSSLSDAHNTMISNQVNDWLTDEGREGVNKIHFHDLITHTWLQYYNSTLSKINTDLSIIINDPFICMVNFLFLLNSLCFLLIIECIKYWMMLDPDKRLGCQMLLIPDLSTQELLVLGWYSSECCF